MDAYINTFDRLLILKSCSASLHLPPLARSFMQELRDLAVCLKNLNRRPGQVITFGVAAGEPPGRSLNEARLCLVVLEYITPEDWGAIKRTSPQELKWQRLERLATQAYA